MKKKLKHISSETGIQKVRIPDIDIYDRDFTFYIQLYGISVLENKVREYKISLVKFILNTIIRTDLRYRETDEPIEFEQYFFSHAFDIEDSIDVMKKKLLQLKYDSDTIDNMYKYLSDFSNIIYPENE